MAISRENRLGPLQLEFLELLTKLGEVTEQNKQELEDNIRTMNAAELRKNISVLTEANDDRKRFYKDRFRGTR